MDSFMGNLESAFLISALFVMGMFLFIVLIFLSDKNQSDKIDNCFINADTSTDYKDCVQSCIKVYSDEACLNKLKIYKQINGG